MAVLARMYFQDLLIIVFLGVLVSGKSLSIVDFCDVDRRNSSVTSPGLQFTKELSSSEYTVVSTFKSLHCCAKGYLSIEWYKGDKAYPWPADVSSFILYPESANQTIYSQAVTSFDAGNYTCRVVNDSQAVSHTTSLTVFDISGYMDEPLATYRLPTEHYVRLGQTARLYCEAFVGRIDLPDAVNEASWVRPGVNMSAEDETRYHQKIVSREKDQILGAYLFIEKVGRSDFGEYVCTVSNSGDQIIRLTTLLREEDWEVLTPQHVVPWPQLLIISAAAVLSILTAVVVYQRFALPTLLFLKQLCGKREQDDGLDFDVLVCYNGKDSEFTLGVLVPTLENRYNYTAACCQINNTTVSPELNVSATLSRRLLVVVSASLCGDQWTPAAISHMFRQLIPIHSNIVCVTIQPLPQGEACKNDDGVEMKRLLANVEVVPWESKTVAERHRFWTALRLCLPIPRKVTTDVNLTSRAANTVNSGKSKLSPFAKSNESLEVLV